MQQRSSPVLHKNFRAILLQSQLIAAEQLPRSEARPSQRPARHSASRTTVKLSAAREKDADHADERIVRATHIEHVDPVRRGQVSHTVRPDSKLVLPVTTRRRDVEPRGFFARIWAHVWAFVVMRAGSPLSRLWNFYNASLKVCDL